MRHWPPGVDEAAIRLPREPLSLRLKRTAERCPDKPAIVFYGREVTFGELDEASDRFAGWLVSGGHRPGDRVAIDLENCPQFAIAYFGALKAGAIVVCLNPMHKAIELQPEFQDSGARVLVTSDQLYPGVEAIRSKTALEAVVLTWYRDFLPPRPALPVPPALLEPARRSPETEDFRALLTMTPPLGAPRPRNPDDTALIQYTSGTTATAEALRDGWLFTGDIGRVDEEGYFIVEERKKDMIKASGYSVFPAEVEALMYRHPAIAEVGVVGVADPYRGEDVLAFVVLRPEARDTISEQAIVDWCRAEMAVYKAPRRVRFIEALPKTASGKILKRALRDVARQSSV